MLGATSASLTLADVRERICRDDSLPERRRRRVLQCLERLRDILGTPLAAVEAKPKSLRERLDRIHPVQAGISQNRLANIRSNLTFALKHCGIATFRTSRRPFSQHWRPLFDRLPIMRHRIGLSRFMKFCDWREIRPEDVSDTTSQAFRDTLVHDSLVRNPEHVHRNTCKIWNEAADQVPGWPQTRLSVPASRHRYFHHHWERLPRSFREEVDRYLAWRCGESTAGKEPPLEAIGPTTKKHVLGHIRALVASLAEQGYDAGQLASLSEMVTVESVKNAIRHRNNVQQGNLTPHDARLVATAIHIARDWVRAGDQRIKELEGIYRHVRPIERVLSERSVSALRQFTSDDNLRLILELPDRLMQEARRGDHGLYKATVAAQMAVAIEILLSAPMYPADVAKLQILRNLKYLDGPRGNLYIAISGEQSAKGRELTFVLTRHGTELVTEYMLKFLPRSAQDAAPWLFPGEAGSHKNVAFFRNQITRTIYSHTGLKLTPFQFRHLAAMIILDRDPYAHEVVRQLLGHAHLQHTLSIYGVLDTQNAIARFDKLLAGSHPNAEPHRTLAGASPQ